MTRRKATARGSTGGDGTPPLVVASAGIRADRIHEVLRGETLGAIATRYLGSSAKWRVIAEVNGIADPNRLRVGQRLRIPERATDVAPDVLNPVPPPAGGGDDVRFAEEGGRYFAVTHATRERIYLGKKFRRGLFRNGDHEPETLLERSGDLVSDLGLTGSEIRVMVGTAENEGNLDAINTWDANYLSFGMFQWTAGQAGQTGELPALLDEIRHREPELFDHYWGRYGLAPIEVSGPYGHLAIDGQKLANDPQKARLRGLEWVLRFVRAGADLRVQAFEVVHAIRRLDGFYFRPDDRLAGLALADLLTSEYAVALLLDNHVNRPAYVVPCVRAALDCVGKTPPQLRDGSTALERQVLRAYLRERETHGRSPMTDAAQRAAVTESFVTRGELSEERGSFESGRASRG